MFPARGDGLLNTADAARSVRVSRQSITNWRKRGILQPAGLDERGYPLYERKAVRRAEREVREKGLDATGVDPRLVRAAKQHAHAERRRNREAAKSAAA